MPSWKSLLNDDPTDWLLEDENQSVKYFTMLDILEEPLKNKVVIESKKQIMKTGVVPKILEKQNPGGYWGKPEDFYVRSKYRGTVWNLIILASLGADKDNNSIKKTVVLNFNDCTIIFNLMSKINHTSINECGRVII